MGQYRKLTQDEVEEVKDYYKKWKNGISLHPDRPDGAGEDYLMGRARFFLTINDLCGNYSDNLVAEGLNDAVLHREALCQLGREGGLEELKEENQQEIIKLLEDVEEGLRKVDWSGLSKTKTQLKLWSLEKETREVEKMKVIPEKLSEGHLKIQEDVGNMLRGKRGKPKFEKIDACLSKVWNYGILRMHHEERGNAESKKYAKGLKRELFKIMEIQKMLTGFLKKRGEGCYPIVKGRVEERLKIIDRIIAKFVK